MASVVTLVLPAQPAAAASYCTTEPHTPGMIDYKIQEIDGANRAYCQGKMAVVRSEAKLEQWFTRAQRWQQVSYGDNAEKDVTTVWADAYISCAGMGEVSYRTVGYATGVAASSWNSQDGWRTGYYKTFQCSHELSAIKP